MPLEQGLEALVLIDIGSNNQPRLGFRPTPLFKSSAHAFTICTLTGIMTSCIRMDDQPSKVITSAILNSVWLNCGGFGNEDSDCEEVVKGEHESGLSNPP